MQCNIFLHVCTLTIISWTVAYKIQTLPFVFRVNNFVIHSQIYSHVIATWLSGRMRFSFQESWMMMDIRLCITKAIRHCANCKSLQRSFHFSLQWRNNGRNGVTNQQRLDYLSTTVEAQIKENIKASRHWLLWGECADDRQIPLTKDQ